MPVCILQRDPIDIVSQVSLCHRNTTECFTQPGEEWLFWPSIPLVLCPIDGLQAFMNPPRAMITTTLVNNVWVTGATIYGEPESGAYPQQKANNEALLTAAASQVCYLHKGPRYVAGDWNVDYGTLQAFSLLENAGFVDLQDLAVQKWGIPFAPFCSHV